MRIKAILSSLPFWRVICGIICFVIGYFLEGFTQAVVLAFGAGLSIEPVISKVEDVVSYGRIKFFLRSTLFIIVVFSAFIIGWYLGYPLPEKYPRSDGLVADFTTGAGGPARNALGESFTVILDSDNNQISKCWYENISSEDGNGFLRIYYQLIPLYDRTSYVGVFTDFSHPPPKLFDVSYFSKVNLRIRLGQPIEPSNLGVFVVLATANVQGAGWYDYCEYQIPWHALQSEWIVVKAPFDKMSTPPWSPRKTKLDPKRAFRLSILIKGKPGPQQHSHIDIDDIKFEE